VSRLPVPRRSDNWRRATEDYVAAGPEWRAGLGEAQNWRIALHDLVTYYAHKAGMDAPVIPARYQSLVPVASWGTWLRKVEREA